MTEALNGKPDIEQIPEAVIANRSRMSIVWLIPLVAALVGGWLAYKALSEKGPTITITFNTAESLEAGKTLVRYKDVDIGKVQTIELSRDLSKVVVTASLVKGAEEYLNEETRFWVVRARVGAGQISGLGTLLSGAYIGIDPGKGKKSKLEFTGMEKPPAVTMNSPGRSFALRAEKLGSLDVGSPIYFRQIRVGEVIGYALAPAGRAVNIEIFIHAPHHKRVYKNTRFYNVAGLTVALDASGVRINTESLLSLLIGGVAFETPADLDPGGQAGEETIFRLFDSYDSINEKSFSLKQYYVLYFDESIRGLSIGAPVELRGIPLGEVVDINLKYIKETASFRIPVLIALEPERIDIERDPEEDDEEFLERLIKNGLRAQLRTGSLLTGQLFVDLGFHPEAPPPAHPPKLDGRYPEIPTIQAPLKEITASLTNALSRIGKIPFEEIGDNLNRAIEDIRRLAGTATGEVVEITAELKPAVTALKKTLEETQVLVQKLQRESAPALNEALGQTRKTLAAAENTLSSNAPVITDLQNTLNELSGAARSIRMLADYLERHPEALLRGKGGD